MQINLAVLRAYEAIEKAIGPDTLGQHRPPSLGNLLYGLHLKRQFLCRIGIGIALSSLSDENHRYWIAHYIQSCFWRDLGLSKRPEMPIEHAPHMKPGDFRWPSIDVAALSAKLSALPESEPDFFSIAKCGISSLTDLLHLSPAETSLLQLAYASDQMVVNSSLAAEEDDFSTFFRTGVIEMA